MGQALCSSSRVQTTELGVLLATSCEWPLAVGEGYCSLACCSATSGRNGQATRLRHFPPLKFLQTQHAFGLSACLHRSTCGGLTCQNRPSLKQLVPSGILLQAASGYTCSSRSRQQLSSWPGSWQQGRVLRVCAPACCTVGSTQCHRNAAWAACWQAHLDAALQQVQLCRAWLAQGLGLASRSGLSSVILQNHGVRHHAAQSSWTKDEKGA